MSDATSDQNQGETADLNLTLLIKTSWAGGIDESSPHVSYQLLRPEMGAELLEQIRAYAARHDMPLRQAVMKRMRDDVLAAVRRAVPDYQWMVEVLDADNALPGIVPEGLVLIEPEENDGAF